MHPLGILSLDEKVVEGFDVAGLLEARRLSWLALERSAKEIRVGMSADEAVDHVSSILAEMGSPRSWHKPIVRFGVDTAKGYNQKSDGNRLLEEEDLFYLDIGPTWNVSGSKVEYEGDVGKTFCVGDNPAHKRCQRISEELFALAIPLWREEKITGVEMFHWLSEQALQRGVELIADVSGHRISDYPHIQYTKKRLFHLDFSPAEALWVLEVHIRVPDRGYGAFYEDILLKS